MADETLTPWMTKIGAVLIAISGAFGGAGQVLPIPEAKPWLDFLAILLGSIGAALMGQGIRRNIPTMRVSGRTETLTESREGADDQPARSV